MIDVDIDDWRVWAAMWFAAPHVFSVVSVVGLCVWHDVWPTLMPSLRSGMAGLTALMWIVGGSMTFAALPRFRERVPCRSCRKRKAPPYW